MLGDLLVRMWLLWKPVWFSPLALGAPNLVLGDSLIYIPTQTAPQPSTTPDANHPNTPTQNAPQPSTTPEKITGFETDPVHH